PQHLRDVGQRERLLEWVVVNQNVGGDDQIERRVVSSFQDDVQIANLDRRDDRRTDSHSPYLNPISAAWRSKSRRNDADFGSKLPPVTDQIRVPLVRGVLHVERKLEDVRAALRRSLASGFEMLIHARAEVEGRETQFPGAREP